MSESLPAYPDERAASPQCGGVTGQVSETATSMGSTSLAGPSSASSTVAEARSILQLEQVSVRLGTQEVLRDICLAIPRGQSVALIGESGCGKTVFLKVLVGLIRPSRGRVCLDGVELHSLPEEELVRQRLRFGFVFQAAALFDSMNVFENVAFPLRQHTNLDEASIRQRVIQQLAEIGLGEEVLAKYPAELSGGMRKRVGLARALILRPEIMLYDEPTTGLDPIMADIINSLIKQTHEKHQVTSVVVTHDLKTVRTVAQRVVMLYPLRRLAPGEEQIIFDGPVSQLEQAQDKRVRQFVLGQAGEYLHLTD